MRIRSTASVILTAGCLVGACSRQEASAPAAAANAPGEWFTEEAARVGLDFVHFNGMSGERYYPEIMAPGVGVLDYDNDGDLDVYVVQGQMLGPKRLEDAIYPPKGQLRDRLFRNDLAVKPDGTRILHFTDVTEQSGIDIRSYGMGVAVGDIDNDGWVDIYRTGLDGCVMLRNNGDGTFTDVTARTGTANRGGWAVSASFVDYDRDGWLDLYVGNYLIYSIEGDIDCLSVSGQHDYCPPNSYRPQPDRLYRNRGNGTFEEVTARALRGGAYGPALGVSTADFDGDGWIDIYVGNDGTPNQLWINQRDGTFRDMAFLNGVAVSGGGNAEASMGIDAGDFDNDGDEDLFVTNWLAQMNVIYVNLGGAVFEDRRGPTGLGPPSLAKTGFGTAWFDYDNDGWLDLLAVNGGVAIIEAQARAKDPFPLRMANQLYRNLGNGRFEDVSARAGTAFELMDVGRGAAFGDIDNDGDVDVVIGNAAGPLRLLLNHVGNRQHWVGLRLIGIGGRDMFGARIAVVRRDGTTLWRRARSDGSYASANDPRVLVGLGSHPGPVTVRVQWPDGRTEQWTDVPVGRWTTLRQGTGR
ncbi:MAG TPA: CRTAC1 family protein [Vicinamibacterales bacterium]|nr:CRTAC1 family protein [Vicinamibacterales bacterium]